MLCICQLPSHVGVKELFVFVYFIPEIPDSGVKCLRNQFFVIRKLLSQIQKSSPGT